MDFISGLSAGMWLELARLDLQKTSQKPAHKSLKPTPSPKSHSRPIPVSESLPKTSPIANSSQTVNMSFVLGSVHDPGATGKGRISPLQ